MYVDTHTQDALTQSPFTHGTQVHMNDPGVLMHTSGQDPLDAHSSMSIFKCKIKSLMKASQQITMMFMIMHKDNDSKQLMHA